ncbi:MAG: hypothetical protein ABJP45_03430 [Cyclobacteriaceae bacterium]
MNYTDLRTYIFHFLVFLGFVVYFSLEALRDNSFYSQIGFINLTGTAFALILIYSLIARYFLRGKESNLKNELIVSIVISGILAVNLYVFSGQDTIAEPIIVSVVYLCSLELVRLIISSFQTGKFFIFTKRLNTFLPLPIIAYIILSTISLIEQFPTIYEVWQIILTSTISLTVILFITISKSVKNQLTRKLVRGFAALNLAGILITFSVVQIARSATQERLEEAYLTYESRDYEASKELATNILKYDPYNPVALYVNGCNLFAMKSFEEARIEFSQIVRNPNRRTNEQQNQQVWYRMHLCKVELGLADDETIARYQKLEKVQLDLLADIRAFKY